MTDRESAIVDNFLNDLEGIGSLWPEMRSRFEAKIHRTIEKNKKKQGKKAQRRRENLARREEEDLRRRLHPDNGRSSIFRARHRWNENLSRTWEDLHEANEGAARAEAIIHIQQELRSEADSSK